MKSVRFNSKTRGASQRKFNFAMVLGTTGVGGTPASARRRGIISPRGPPLSPWSRRAIRPNTVNVDSSQHLTGTLI